MSGRQTEIAAFWCGLATTGFLTGTTKYAKIINILQSACYKKISLLTFYNMHKEENMKIAICDAEDLFVRKLYQYLWQQPGCTVESFLTSAALLEKYAAGAKG